MFVQNTEISVPLSAEHGLATSIIYDDDIGFTMRSICIWGSVSDSTFPYYGYLNDNGECSEIMSYYCTLFC